MLKGKGVINIKWSERKERERLRVINRKGNDEEEQNGKKEEGKNMKMIYQKGNDKEEK